VWDLVVTMDDATGEHTSMWECLNFCVRGARRLVHGGGRRLRRTTDAVGKSVPHITRLLL
jgi:hypothetical protein